MLRICASLKALLSALPRCPEVPNATRCDAIFGSGRLAKYAVTSRGTFASMDGGAILPASGEMSAGNGGILQDLRKTMRHSSPVLYRDKTRSVSRTRCG